MFLFTDGLIENENVGGRMWGERRLVHYLKQHQSLGTAQLVDQLSHDMSSFLAHHPLDDDMTISALKVIQPFPGAPTKADE